MCAPAPRWGKKLSDIFGVVVRSSSYIKTGVQSHRAQKIKKTRKRVHTVPTIIQRPDNGTMRAIAVTFFDGSLPYPSPITLYDFQSRPAIICAMMRKGRRHAPSFKMPVFQHAHVERFSLYERRKRAPRLPL